MKTGKTFDVTEKARIYHTLAQMSSSFSSIIRYCDDLEAGGALTPKTRRHELLVKKQLEKGAARFLSSHYHECKQKPAK